MYFYFLSEFPSAIKLNGIYFGQIYPEIKGIDIELSSPTLIEVCPLKKGEQPLSFIIDDSFPKDFDAFASVTDLDGGYFINFKSTFTRREMFVLSQERFPDLSVSVFNENGIKISIETINDFYAEDVQGEYLEASIKKINLDNQEFLAVSLNNAETIMLYVFNVKGKIQKLFCDKVNEFSCENSLKTTTYLNDILKHVLHVTWEISADKFVQKTKTIESKIDLKTLSCHEKVLPYAFLEEVLVGGDPISFLSDELIEYKDNLYDYFKGVIGIMPPPPFKNHELVGLVYKEDLDRYKVRYTQIKLNNRKITDIKIL